jgi:hypothetical protein
MRWPEAFAASVSTANCAETFANVRFMNKAWVGSGGQCLNCKSRSRVSGLWHVRLRWNWRKSYRPVRSLPRLVSAFWLRRSIHCPFYERSYSHLHVGSAKKCPPPAAWMQKIRDIGTELPIPSTRRKITVGSVGHAKRRPPQFSPPRCKNFVGQTSPGRSSMGPLARRCTVFSCGANVVGNNLLWRSFLVSICS